jgi:glycerophosphoryl diester phosphodiesterase
MAQIPNLPALFTQTSRPVTVIAHRGASAHYPENTMAAFKGALKANADMIEFDVMLSADGVPVVFHDRNLNAHTNGKGPVKEHTLSELKKLDAGSWFDARFSNEKIPTLEEVLEWASKKIALNIEIKPSATANSADLIVTKCLDFVRKYEMQKHVLFSSFDYEAVKKLKEMEDSVSTAIVYNRSKSPKSPPHELIEEYRADAFNCNFWELTKRRKNDLQQHGIPHFIYTVDEPKEMIQLLQAGVTGIFTNKPALLIEVAKTYQENMKSFTNGSS